MDAPVVLTQRQPRWFRGFVGVYAVIVLGMAASLVLGGDSRRLLSFVVPAVLLALGVAVLVRPPRVELHDDALVTRSLRTVRIPYADVAAVRGDVPSRLDWSTRLVVERHSGRPVTLPPLDLAPRELHDLIARRAGLE